MDPEQAASTCESTARGPRNLRDLEPGKYHEEVSDFVQEVIFQQGGAIVYLNKSLELDYCISEGDYGDWPEDFGRLEVAAAALQAKPVDHLTSEQLRLFRSLVGQAFGAVLAGRPLEEAIHILQEADRYHSARIEEGFRFRYLSFVLLATVIACFLSFGVWGARARVDDLLAEGAALVVSVSLLASLGVLVSTALRLESVHSTTVGSRRLHSLEAAVRVIVGVVAGLLAVLAVKSGVVLGGWIRPENTNLVLLMVAIAAGLAERAAPNLARLVSDGHEAVGRSALQEPERPDGAKT